MALCLKRLKNLHKVKLIDANFVWTEPHSKRIKASWVKHIVLSRFVSIHFTPQSDIRQG
jgi:NMD protein affecting ribosome stability and mRNA decay